MEVKIHRSNKPVTVTDAQSLQQAIERKAAQIQVQGKITGLSSLKLPAGTRLHGTAGAELHFKEGQPGLMLSADHQVSDLRVVADETQIALGLSDDAEGLGTLDIHDVRTVGRFHLEGTQARSGHLKLRQVYVKKADARLAAHRPAGFGVEMLLGGFNVYNASTDSGRRWRPRPSVGAART